MYLLDTHTLIWFLADSPELSATARNTICSDTDIYISYASLWEMSIKKSLGKLRFPYTFEEMAGICKEESIQLLGIDYPDLDIEAWTTEARDEERKAGIRAFIAGAKALAASPAQVVEQLVKNYPLTEAEAQAAVQANW